MKQWRCFISIVCVVIISIFLSSCLNKDSSSTSSVNEEDNWEGLKIIKLEKVRDSRIGGDVLNDIISHYMSGSYCSPYEKYADSELPTYAHEATHGLNACIKNNKNTTGKLANGFYLLEGKAAVVETPGIKMSVVAQYVPDTLQNMGGDVCKDPDPKNRIDCRFDTYVVGQSDGWNYQPLYIFDEWTAYINGAKEAINLFKKNKISSDNYGLVHGAIEFMVYSSALVKAVSEKDSSYFKSNTQFKALYKYLFKTTISIYNQGKGKSQLVAGEAETYMNNFKNSDLYSFIKSNFSGVDI